MAATKTRTRKQGAKKTSRPKPSAAPGVKGRTSKALKNRFDWQAHPEMLAEMISAVDNAERGTKQAVFEKYAKQVGNNIQWKSVRAIYYMYKNGKTTTSSGGAVATGSVPSIPKAEKLPSDPVARVRAMVNRRGLLVRTVNKADAELAKVNEQLASLTARKAALNEAAKAAKAEVKELDGRLANIAG